MSATEETLKDFFARYAERMNEALTDGAKLDPSEIASAFATSFIEASPAGINCCRNDARYLEQIPKGFDFYRSLGTISMDLVSVNVTELDDLHSMAKVHWDSQYESRNGEDVRIEFDVYYFVQFVGGQPKIFAYITGDENLALKKHGLI
jgi:hypothetical protein